MASGSRSSSISSGSRPYCSSWTLPATISQYTLDLLKSELNTYNSELTEKPYYILLNKIDLVTMTDTWKEKDLKDKNVLPISAATGRNIDELLAIIDKLMENERCHERT